MEESLSRFETLIGDNLSAFHIMVQGALKDWDGVYDVFLVDQKRYLIGSKTQTQFREYCRKLREYPKGERLCTECDLQAAQNSGKQTNKYLIYLCHGGLRDIVSPIVINGEVIAAILCGQVRPENPEQDHDGLMQTIALEKKLGIPSGDLVYFRKETTVRSEEVLSDLAERLSTMTKFVSKALEAQQELIVKNNMLEHERNHQSQVIKIHSQIDEAISALLHLHKTWEDLWLTLDQFLLQIIETFNAQNAAFLVYDKEITEGPRTTLQAMARIIPNLERGMRLNNDQDFENWGSPDEVNENLFDGSIPNTLCYYVREARDPEEPELYQIVIVHTQIINDNILGLFVLFFDINNPWQYDTNEEKAELNLIASRLAQAYSNTITHLGSVEEAAQQKVWIKKIEHQVLSPLNGVLGHAENLWERFEELFKTKDNQEGTSDDNRSKLENIYNSLIDTAGWAATVMRNLTWSADIEGNRKRVAESPLEFKQDVPKYLIECARYFQGIAGLRGIQVHVDTGSVSSLNNNIRIHPDFFRMAIQNLLDNAVKYSNDASKITIEGVITAGHVRLRIINYGIRLTLADIDHIFDYGYRTNTARIKRRPGTGIGLFIAQEIISEHKGRITANPSELTARGWKTEFTIILPRHTNREK